jgi:hypothetical protein
MSEFAYWPDTEHPAYSGHSASLIRSMLTSTQHAALEIFTTNPEPEKRTDLLTIRKAAGPAPYVGKPFAYTWKVAVDSKDRWVAGSAEIVYLPEDPLALAHTSQGKA